MSFIVPGFLSLPHHYFFFNAPPPPPPNHKRPDGTDLDACTPFTTCRYECAAGCSERSRCSSSCTDCLLTDDSSFCLACEDGQYLYDGRCHSDCDAFVDTRPSGDEMAGRECMAVKPSALRPAPALEWEYVAGTPSSDKVCKPRSPCGVGSFIVTGWTITSDVVCVKCPSGFTDHDSDSNTPCSKCSQGTLLCFVLK
jgi:hypothetical protein